MFDGRHCNNEDLTLLNKETDKIISSLLKDESFENELKSFLDFVQRFDIDIAFKIKREIAHSPLNREKIIKVIKTNIDVLKQNVIVDINEHR